MITSRRSFITGFGSLIAAPAMVAEKTALELGAEIRRAGLAGP